MVRQFSSAVAIVTFLFALRTHAADDGGWKIHGQVVDEQDQPTDDFDASTFWWANGKNWDEKGELIAPSGQQSISKMWKDEGVLDARQPDLAKHQSDGKFTIDIEDRPRVALFAVDRQRKQGGVVAVEKDAADKGVTIKLAPLVRVHGNIKCNEEDRVPDWTNTNVHLLADRGNYLKFMICGSVRGQFALPLPPGKYDLDVYSSGPDAHMPKPKERKLKDAPADMPPFLSGIRIDVPPGAEFDLGTLNVELPKDENGVAHDYSLFYGKEPPAIGITDARGVPKTVRLSDFHGKWVIVDFWALWCGPCVRDSLPELTKFYEEHAADRDRFEILAICNTKEEKLLTIEDYDVHAAPIVKEVWDGKELPFPVLIDGEGKTFTEYGIQSWPTTLFIDPEGHLVKHGSLESLAKELESK